MGRTRLGVLVLVACALILADTASAERQKPNRACSAYMVLVSRGSGEPYGLGGPGNATVSELRRVWGPGADTAITAVANPYPARGLDVHHLRQLLNGVGALLHVGKLGGYTDSVKDGSDWLRRTIAKRIDACPADPNIILVGYSQGAQVTADVYQRLDRFTRTFIVGVVLYGDPYFRGDSSFGQSEYNSHLHGILGQRPEYADDAGGRLLSYCHAGDPICQGIGAGRSAVAHKYTSTVEPRQAARYLLQWKTLRRVRLGTGSGYQGVYRPRQATAKETTALERMARPLCTIGPCKLAVSQYDQHYGRVIFAGSQGYSDNSVGRVGFRVRGDGGSFRSATRLPCCDGIFCPRVGDLRLRRALRTLNACDETGWVGAIQDPNCSDSEPCVLTGDADPDGQAIRPQRILLYDRDGKPAAVLENLTWPKLFTTADHASGTLLLRSGKRTKVTLHLTQPGTQGCGGTYWSQITMSPAQPLSLHRGCYDAG